MYYLPDYKLCFIAHPRTGSNAVRVALEEMGAIHEGPHHSVQQIPPGWRAACGVRSHWDLIRSYYERPRREAHAHLIPFEQYTREITVRAPYFWEHRLFPYTGACHYVLRQEHLQDEFSAMLRDLGAPDRMLPEHENASVLRREHPVVWTRDFADWIFDRYHDEIIHLGYEDYYPHVSR